MGLKGFRQVISMDASIRWKGPLVCAKDFCGDYSLGFGDIGEEITLASWYLFFL